MIIIFTVLLLLVKQQQQHSPLLRSKISADRFSECHRAVIQYVIKAIQPFEFKFVLLVH